jgi:hypothetical protein
VRLERITRGVCSVCGHALSGGRPCQGGFKIETEPKKAKAATNDGLALQCRNVAGGNEHSIAQYSEAWWKGCETGQLAAVADRGDEVED